MHASRGRTRIIIRDSRVKTRHLFKPKRARARVNRTHARGGVSKSYTAAGRRGNVTGMLFDSKSRKELATNATGYALSMFHDYLTFSFYQ